MSLSGFQSSSSFVSAFSSVPDRHDDILFDTADRTTLNNFAVAFRGQRQLAGNTPNAIHLKPAVFGDTSADSLDAAVTAYQAKQNANCRHPFATAYGYTARLETAVADRCSSRSSPLAVAYAPLAKRR